MRLHYRVLIRPPQVGYTNFAVEFTRIGMLSHIPTCPEIDAGARQKHSSKAGHVASCSDPLGADVGLRSLEHQVGVMSVALPNVRSQHRISSTGW
ncbi:AsnC family transcriptional regulator [Anopheles sinensis]|uniref:AsnC family transcriptional regulator n=1 Tax=Anopheles sinensis TaxID=74873 RepID=A0A084W4Z7_ANOSI|nr:AsnC family transcriptional regulator [Anopheles sinensis]